MIDENMLNEAFLRGLIPGPTESEDQFLKRIEASTPILMAYNNAKERFSNQFLFFPDWVHIKVKHSSLPFFGAVTSIEENIECGAILSCTIELNARLLGSKFLKKFYPIEELLSHEWVHSARAAFECPQYEEIIAYQTSKSSFRRMVGPFFDNTILSKTLIYSGIILLILPFISLFLSETSALSVGLFLYSFFLTLLSFKACILFKRLKIFNRCLKIMEAASGCKRKALSLVVALTDEEIQHTVSSNKTQWIFDYENQSLRHRLITSLLRSFRRS